jgi:hypothetical protein
MLDCLKGNDQVEASIRMWQGVAGGALEVKVGQAVILSGERDGIGGSVGTNDGSGYVCQLGGSVAGAATGIEHAPDSGQTRSENVAGPVLIEQVIAHLTGNEPLAGEFNCGFCQFVLGIFSIIRPFGPPFGELPEFTLAVGTDQFNPCACDSGTSGV